MRRSIPDQTARLTEAARLGNLDKVADFVARDASCAREFDHNGWTALHVAAHFGHVEIVEVLLENGAELEARSENTASQNPLHMAIGAGNAGMVELLLARGADPNARLVREWTPLHQAALHGDAEIAKLLLSAGAQANAEAIDRKMPVDIALMQYDSEMEDLLRSHGGRSFKEPWLIAPDEEDQAGWWRQRFR